MESSDGDARSAGNVIEVIKHGRMRDERREEAELEWLGACRPSLKPCQKPRPKRKHREREECLRWSPASDAPQFKGRFQFLALSALLLNILSIQIQQLPFNASATLCLVDETMVLTVAPRLVFAIAFRLVIKD